MKPHWTCIQALSKSLALRTLTPALSPRPFHFISLRLRQLQPNFHAFLENDASLWIIRKTSSVEITYTLQGGRGHHISECKNHSRPCDPLSTPFPSVVTLCYTCYLPEVWPLDRSDFSGLQTATSWHNHPAACGCRAMEFVVALLRRLYDEPAEPLPSAAQDAYATTLQPFHGWISSSAFTLAMRVMLRQHLN